MPDRLSDLPLLSIASKRRRTPHDDQARRMTLLDATVMRWLHDAGEPQTSASTQARALAPMVSQWLGETTPERLFDLLPSLADHLRMQLPHVRPLTAGGFINAFAHSLVAHAVDEVALEARRAGHSRVFASLRPYLHGEPTPNNLTELGTTLQLSQAALAIALSRLRHRLRGTTWVALSMGAA